MNDRRTRPPNPSESERREVNPFAVLITLTALVFTVGWVLVVVAVSHIWGGWWAVLVVGAVLLAGMFVLAVITGRILARTGRLDR